MGECLKMPPLGRRSPLVCATTESSSPPPALMAGQVVMGSSASATVALGTGFQTSVAAKSSNSLSLTISGVPKARVKVKVRATKQVLRSSTVMSLPTGKYRVRAFAVKKNGTSCKPKHRKFTLRARGGKRFAVKVHYRPVSKTVTIDPSVEPPRVAPRSPPHRFPAARSAPCSRW